MEAQTAYTSVGLNQLGGGVLYAFLVKVPTANHTFMVARTTMFDLTVTDGQ